MLAIIVRNERQKTRILEIVRGLVSNPGDMPAPSSINWDPTLPIFMYVQDDRWEGWDGNRSVLDNKPFFKDAEIIDLGE